MKKVIVTMLRPDTTKVEGIFGPLSDEQAKSKALAIAKGIATGPEQSKVILAGIPLKAVAVEQWEDCSLRAVSGDKPYRVLLITERGSKEVLVMAAGLKSAFAIAVKENKLQHEEVSAFIYELGQKGVAKKPVAPKKLVVSKKFECIECGENFEIKDIEVIEDNRGYICKSCLKNSEDYGGCLDCGEVLERGYSEYVNLLASVDSKHIKTNNASEVIGSLCPDCEDKKYIICQGCNKIGLDNPPCIISITETEQLYYGDKGFSVKVCSECLTNSDTLGPCVYKSESSNWCKKDDYYTEYLATICPDCEARDVWQGLCGTCGYEE